MWGGGDAAGKHISRTNMSMGRKGDGEPGRGIGEFWGLDGKSRSVMIEEIGEL